MKKLDSLIFTFTMLTNSTVFAADTAKATPVYGEVKENKVKDASGADATLQKLLTVKGVDEKYKACQTKTPKVELEKMAECIWTGLDDKVKKEVTKMYEAETEIKSDGRSPASAASASSNLTKKSKLISVDYMNDPAVVALSEVFKKKLDQAIMGTDPLDPKSKTITVVDHDKYIELYRTELGKTIISAFTSYCIAAEVGDVKYTTQSKCTDNDNTAIPCPLYYLAKADKRDAQIKTNIQSLKNANFDNSTKTVSNQDMRTWQNCIASVSNVCYTDSTAINGTVDVDQLKDSKKQACIITDYVKSARTSLIAADEQVKYYEKLGSGTSFDIGNAKNIKVTDKNSADAVSTITSKEVEDSYQVANDKIIKDMEKCQDKNGNINKESCKNFISTDTENKEKAMTEFGIRQYALGDALNDKLDNDKDKTEVTKYLKGEGYDDNKIKNMTSNPADLKLVIQEIKDRYKSERDAIISSMAEKVQGKTTEKTGTIAGQTDSDKLTKIKDELKDRSEDLKQVVHFNNIVSSYLEIDNGKEKTRNVASLYAEVSNSAKTIKGEDIKDDSKSIKAKADAAGLEKDIAKNQNGGTNLSVENLNSLMKYSTEKPTEK